MTADSSKQFQHRIYQSLDEKLRASSWKSGASEAHGLLTGLACRGVTSEQLASKLYLLQIESDADASEYPGLLEGLFELIIRDLNSSQPVFDVLIPHEREPIITRVDELASWGGGFIQGFCNDGDSAISDLSLEAQELIHDIIDISGMQLDQPNPESDDQDKALTEVEEFLRVGIQLIYDEAVANQSNSPHADIAAASSDHLH